MKKQLLNTIGLLAVASCLCGAYSPTTTLAADKESAAESGSTEPAEMKGKRYPFRGKVGEIDSKAKTFTIIGKEKKRVFHFTRETKIVMNESPATFEDLKVGVQVGGLVLETEDGTLKLVSLRIGPKPGAADKDSDSDES